MMIRVAHKHSLNKTTGAFTLVPTNELKLKTKLKTQWYSLDSYERRFWLDFPEDTTIGPTCLSAWVK